MSIYLNGTNAYCQAADNSSLDFSNDMSAQIRFKIPPDNTTGGILLAKYDDYSQGYLLQVYKADATNTALSLTIRVGSGSTNVSVLEGFVPHADVFDNEWHTLAFTRQGGLGTVYFDGVSKASAAVKTGTLGSTQPLYIGRWKNGLYFKGYIDSADLWTSALTAQQIADYANGVSTVTGGEYFARACYKFTENTGTLSEDSTTYNNDLTLYNVQWYTVVTPSNLRYTSKTTTSLRIDWDAPGAVAGTTYKIRMIDNGVTGPENSSGQDKFLTFTGLDEGNKYGFEVASVMPDTTQSPWSTTYWASTTNIAPVATNVSILGTPMPGNTIWGSYTYVDKSSEGTSTYKWYSSLDGVNYSEVSGATSINYTITSEDIGKYFKFEVTPVQQQEMGDVSMTIGLPVQSSAFGPIVYPAQAPVASNVLIAAADFYIGTVLTGSYSYSDANNDTESDTIYKWYRGDTASGPWVVITQGTTTAGVGCQYTLAADDNGKYIRLGITPKNAISPTTGAEVFSTATVKIEYSPTPPVASNVVISGTPEVGQVITGTYQYFDINGDVEEGTTFRWLRSDTEGGTYTEIPGATNLTYTLTSEDVGKYLKFEVTPASV